MQRISKNQIEDIIKLHSEKYSFQAIGRELNICRGVVKYHCKRLNLKTNYHRYTVNENYFNIIDTPNKAYILGFIYADGNVFTNNGAYRLTIGLHPKDVNILKEIKQELDYTGPILMYDDKETKALLAINNKKIIEDLITLGVSPRKSLILEFPTPDIIPYNLMSHFVRGYMDGDGYIGKETISILGTKNFCDNIQKIYNTLDVNSKVSPRSNIYRVDVNGRKQCKIILDYLYTDSIMHLDRKYKKYLIILEHQKNKIKSCKIENCGNKHKGLGYCEKHYYLYKKNKL